MVAALRRALRAQQRGGTVELIETHISFVLLAGGLAYKIKKAVNLGFVDFSTLALRRFYCDEELRLNQRLAPALYLGVLPVTGTVAQPALGGAGAVLDWAVQMRAFAQDDLWDRLAIRGALQPMHIDALAQRLCAFHRGAAVASPADGFGHADQVRAPLHETLDTLDALCTAPAQRAALVALRRWEAAAFEALRSSFDARLCDGWVRECHGDLHLGNVTLIDGQATVFDCLEFSPALRWTDVMSDVAFMAMDLRAHETAGPPQGRIPACEARRLPDALARLSHRFVNACVECSGDAAGLCVLRYYMVYRALVRAKVAALRADQLSADAPPAERDAASDARRRYLGVALACSGRPAPVLMITHGCSGSGKTALTQTLLELCGAIRIRADVERKRLFGLPALARSEPARKPQLYSNQATEAMQARLRDLAGLALRSGYSVILDATFLDHAQREQARALADGLGVRYLILDFQASAGTLRERVLQRSQHADDASEADLAVLEDQLAHAQPLRPEEQAATFVFDTEPALDEAGIAARWAPLLNRLGPAVS
jgi:aminoglycoside phosphotransferase family enzyme/predicted kinase